MPASSSHDGPRDAGVCDAEPGAVGSPADDPDGSPADDDDDADGASADDDAAAASAGAAAAAEFACGCWGPELIASGA